MENDRLTAYQQLAPYLGLGIQLALAIVAFGGIGYYLDGRFGTHPWLLLVGLLCGATGGMIKLIRTAIGANTDPGLRGQAEQKK